LASPAVFDATAIVAVLFKEPGSDAILAQLDGALVSTVNLAEAQAALLRRGAKADFAWRRLVDLGCEIVPFDQEQARLAGQLPQGTRVNGLSLGDRACLALAIERKATVYTTDATWKNLGLGIGVEVIR
jgi:ribonuclease VapC